MSKNKPIAGKGTLDPLVRWKPIKTAPTTGRQSIWLKIPGREPQLAFSNTWWTCGFSSECKPSHWKPNKVIYWKQRRIKLLENSAGPPCSAEICHGPGHQSRTKCQLTGKHDIHYAVYGSYEQVARWRGQRKFSGYFDEPPPEPRQRRKPNAPVQHEPKAIC